MLIACAGTEINLAVSDTVIVIIKVDIVDL